MALRGRGRRQRKEGTIVVQAGQGEHIVNVPFRARDVDAVFTDRQRDRASCEPDVVDEIKITVVEARIRESVVKINWNVSAVRKIRYTILG